MSVAAKQLLASTPLASVLPTNSLVSVTTGCRLEAAIKTLNDEKILSVPVIKQGVRLASGRPLLLCLLFALVSADGSIVVGRHTGRCRWRQSRRACVLLLAGIWRSDCASHLAGGLPSLCADVNSPFCRSTTAASP